MNLNIFFERLEKLGFINEEGQIVLRTKGLKDWPSNLDLENFEIDFVSNGSNDDDGYISGYAGGDWQEMTRFNIVIPKTKKPHVIMFDDPSCFSGENIYKNIEKLYKENKDSKLTESVFNEILFESTSIISDKEFIELYNKRRDATKRDIKKLNDYINNNAEETIFCGTTWKYSVTYYFKKVGNAYYSIYFNDTSKEGSFDVNLWGKKLLRNGQINMSGCHISLRHVSFTRNNDPNTGMNGTLYS